MPGRPINPRERSPEILGCQARAINCCSVADKCSRCFRQLPSGDGHLAVAETTMRIKLQIRMEINVRAQGQKRRTEPKVVYPASRIRWVQVQLIGLQKWCFKGLARYGGPER